MSSMRLLPASTPGRHALARAMLDLRSIGGKVDYRKFVVVGIARTGSTLLTGLLNAHSQVLAFGELFRSPDTIGWDIAPFSGHQGPRLLSRYRTDPIGFLDRHVFRRWPRSYAAVGFKLFYYHARGGPQSVLWDHLSRRRDILVLHLKRRNILAQYYSLQLAHKTENWSIARAAGGAPAPMQLEVEACRRHFAWVRGLERECDALFANHPVREIHYEDLIAAQDSETEAIEGFLGVNRERLAARTARQRMEPLSKVIANYDELKEAFAGTEWAGFFRDPAGLRSMDDRRE
jgi:LPS sulfotransferase NodH